MDRILIVGCPGSGKSTFAKELHRITGIPLIHLDMLFWNEDGTTVEKSVFYERLTEVLEGERWIIDGNYASTMELRMEACDTVIFLDYPVELCLQGIRNRKGKPRSDLPWVEPEEDDEEFLEFIRDYPIQNRPEVLNLLNRYSHKRSFVFTDRAQAMAFLKQLHN